ncbi:FtsX-like permease family protein [Yinghuangia sp. YIM S09857]|uniref:FtsX-like permease family protein n=1 Tax=Yinghuangia sp. YIM S09857 TaxID=3436929 RepID=UPI003F52F64F
MNIPAWRAALRIARREAWRAKGRSLLIVLMIALPVFAGSAADIVYRSQQLDRDERLERKIGQADALLFASPSRAATVQDPDDAANSAMAGVVEWQKTGIGSDQPEELAVDVPASIPAGSPTLTIVRGDLPLRTAHGMTTAGFVELDYTAPLAEGILRQTAGRAPRTADEVVVTEKLLSVGGLRIGGTLNQPSSGRDFTIVGTVNVPDALRERSVFALPGTLLEKLDPLPGPPLTYEYLVDAPPGTYTWDKVRELNAKGIVATSREVDGSALADSEVPYRRIDHAPDRVSDLAVAVGVVVLGMALLEVVLLAGPAFAVGARRRRRELGLVGVAGGDRGHIRTIVLADGVVLGVVAGAVGTALGMAAAWFSRDWFAEMSGKELGHYDVRPLEIAGVIGLGIVIGTVAAAVPAFLAARENIVDSLTGRRGVRRGSRVLPVAGIAAGVLGLGLAYYGAAVEPHDATLLAGCVLAQLGLIACCPALVGLAGRLGRILPLTPRLALRDAARNRPRTAPAVAAVMAAVAGAVAVATYWAGTDHDKRETYLPRAQHGQVLAYTGPGLPISDAFVKAVEDNLPVTGKGVVVGYGTAGCVVGTTCTMVMAQIPPANMCPLHTAGDQGLTREPTPAEIEAAKDDPRCAPGYNEIWGLAGLPVGDAELVRRLNRTDDPRTPEALKHGAVVFDERYIHDGKVTIGISASYASQPGPGGQPTAPPEPLPPPRTVELPAILLESDGFDYAPVILGEEPAKLLGVPPTLVQLVYDTAEMPSEAAQQRAQEAVYAVGGGGIEVERGYQGRPSTQILLLAAATVLVALGASGVATGLALADGRKDLATLGAVGAPPRVRRTLSAAQSWVIALIGTALGVVVGLLPAAALRWKTAEVAERAQEAAISEGGPQNASRLPDIVVVVPWAQMGLALVVIPLLAAGIAALFTRSREVLRLGSG